MTVRSDVLWFPDGPTVANTWRKIFTCPADRTVVVRLLTVVNFQAVATWVYLGIGTDEGLDGTWWLQKLDPESSFAVRDLVLSETHELWILSTVGTGVLCSGFGARLVGVAP